MEKIDYVEGMDKWAEFYRKNFLIDLDLAKFPIDYQECDLRHCFLIVVAKGISMQAVVDAMRKKFVVVSPFVNLDEHLTQNRRAAYRDYMVIVRRDQEVDERWRDCSAEDMAEEKDFSGITLLERLLLGLWYYDTTGDHLDKESITLCTGTADFEGDVYGVSYLSNRKFMEIEFFEGDEAYNCMGPRQIFLPFE